MSSSNRFAPYSVAHSRPAESHASPWMLRWPNDQTGDAGSGLSDGIEPSGLMRRILPPSDDRSCASSRIAALPRRHIELAVRAERDAPAVVDGTRRNAGEDRRLLGQRVPVEAHPHDPVVLAGRDVGEHRLARGGETEQAAFPARRDAGHAADRDSPRRARHVLDRAAVTFGDQRAAVGKKRDPPRHIEVGGDVGGSPGVRLTARFDVTCARDDQHHGRGKRYRGSCDYCSCGGHRTVVPAIPLSRRPSRRQRPHTRAAPVQ